MMVRGRPVKPLGSHGEINVFELKNGRFRAETRLRLETGEIVRVRATGDSPEKAKRLLKERCAQRLGEGESSAITTTSKLSDLLDEWKAQHEVKDRSKGTYERCIDRHIKPKLGEIRLNELTTPRLQSFLNGLSQGTAKTASAILGSALGLAVRWGVLRQNPMRETKLKKRTKKPVNALTDDQMDKYRESIKAWIDDAPKGYMRGDGLLEIIDVLRGSGLRIGEVLALRWIDVDVVNKLITVTGTVDEKGNRTNSPKTDSSFRTIHVSNSAISAICRQQFKAYAQHCEMVFPSGRGTYRTVVNVERQLRSGRGESKIVPHDFRKTVATRIEAQYGTLAASRHLGHANTTVTESAYLASPEIQPDFTTAFE